jgi:mttA/Hcf106 family
MLFGAKCLPEIGHGLGTGIRGFRDGLTLPHDPVRAEPDPGISTLRVRADPPDPMPSTTRLPMGAQLVREAEL